MCILGVAKHLTECFFRVGASSTETWTVGKYGLKNNMGDGPHHPFKFHISGVVPANQTKDSHRFENFREGVRNQVQESSLIGPFQGTLKVGCLKADPKHRQSQTGANADTHEQRQKQIGITPRFPRPFWRQPNFSLSAREKVRNQIRALPSLGWFCRNDS